MFGETRQEEENRLPFGWVLVEGRFSELIVGAALMFRMLQAGIEWRPPEHTSVISEHFPLLSVIIVISLSHSPKVIFD